MENKDEQVHDDTSEHREEEVDTQDTADTTDQSDDDKDWRSEAQKAQELADNYKRRAEKAERKAKESKQEDTTTLTTTDILAIAKADIHEEDIDRVTKFAKMEGISVKEALGNDDLRAILERRAESRKTAQASNTGSHRPSATEKSSDQLVSEARSGKMPDVNNLDAFFEAELKARRRK